MKLILFDTETTSLNAKYGQICQLSYILTDTKTNQSLGKNFFFQVSKVDPETEKVHGYSVDKLCILSGGKRFIELAAEIDRDFQADRFIGHNIDFDEKFLNTEFIRAKIPLKPRTKFCTMKAFTKFCAIYGPYGLKYPKLSDLVNALSIKQRPNPSVCKRTFW